MRTLRLREGVTCPGSPCKTVAEPQFKPYLHQALVIHQQLEAADCHWRDLGGKGSCPGRRAGHFQHKSQGPRPKPRAHQHPPPPKKKKQSLEDSLGQLPRGHFVLGLLAIRLNKLAQRGRKAHARPGLSHSLPLDALRRLLPFQLLPSRQELCSPVWRHPPNGRPPLSSCPRGHIYSAPGTQHGARAAGPHAR